jgi:hypothetical protein
MPQFKPNPDDADANLGLTPEYGREVLFEVVFVGNLVKVTAVDAQTGVEATIVGLPTMTQYSLRMNAVRKLSRVMARVTASAEGTTDDDPEPPQPRHARPGRYA